MVNEAREALRAFVDGRDFKNSRFSVSVEEHGFRVLRTNDHLNITDVVLMWSPVKGLLVYAKQYCANQELRALLVGEITDYIGPEPEGSTRSVAAEWGGPLTWLALKAALTTGGNDAP